MILYTSSHVFHYRQRNIYSTQPDPLIHIFTCVTVQTTQFSTQLDPLSCLATIFHFSYFSKRNPTAKNQKPFYKYVQLMVFEQSFVNALLLLFRITYKNLFSQFLVNILVYVCLSNATNVTVFHLQFSVVIVHNCIQK